MDRFARDRDGSANTEPYVRLILTAAIFAAGALVSRTLLGFAPARFVIDLAQPIPVVTWWGPPGALFIAVLFGAIAAASIPYACSLRRAAQPVRETLAASSIALVAALFWLPLFSSDVYAYAAYGEMARIGINPYVHVTLPTNDPIFRAALWQWSGALPVCVYGTLFVAIAQFVSVVTQHFNIAGQLNAFRVLSCTAFIACTYLLARCGTDERDRRARRAALFFALNPIALWAAAEGHNDTLMLALALCGVVLYRRNRAAGAFVTMLAAAIKVPAILAGGALAIKGVVDHHDWRAVAAAAAGIAVVVCASLPLIYGAAHDLAPHGHYAPIVSVQSLHPLLALAVASGVLLRARNATTDVDRLTLIALAVWLVIPNPYPWYALWLLPLGAWSSDDRISLCVALVAAATMLRYIPDAVAEPNSAATLALGIASLLGYAPLLKRGIIVRS